MELGEGEPVGYHVLAYSTRTLHARTLHAPVRDAECGSGPSQNPLSSTNVVRPTSNVYLLGGGQPGPRDLAEADRQGQPVGSHPHYPYPYPYPHPYP